MTLTATLRAFPDYELVSLNFSSATTPELILKTFDRYCEYKRTPKGTVLRPLSAGKVNHPCFYYCSLRLYPYA